MRRNDGLNVKHIRGQEKRMKLWMQLTKRDRKNWERNEIMEQLRGWNYLKIGTENESMEIIKKEDTITKGNEKKDEIVKEIDKKWWNFGKGRNWLRMRITILKKFLYLFNFYWLLYFIVDVYIMYI